MREEGALRVRFPNVATGDALEAVIVNTAGGMAGGDRFDFDIAVGAGAKLDDHHGGRGKNLSLARAGHGNSM